LVHPPWLEASLDEPFTWPVFAGWAETITDSGPGGADAQNISSSSSNEAGRVPVDRVAVISDGGIHMAEPNPEE
jgi:hypothetical protein